MVVFEKAPAKINLTLDVLWRRNDGFHEVEMVMTTIDLSDRLELYALEKDEIKVSLESRYVPNDERNLAYRAAKLFKDTYGIKQGVHIKIDKDIPVSAGLGGGSSNAAAVLRGLNILWSLQIPLEDLSRLGLAIGSDVPFSVMNHTALVTGRGEIIERLPRPPSCWVVLAKPNIGVSTKTIFQHVKVNTLSHPNTQEVIRALYDQDLTHLSDHLGNSLENVTIGLYPQVATIKQKMIHLGATNVLMSGSGATVYTLVGQEKKAQRIYNGLRGFCQEVYKVHLLG